MRLGVVWEFLL